MAQPRVPLGQQGGVDRGGGPADLGAREFSPSTTPRLLTVPSLLVPNSDTFVTPPTPTHPLFPVRRCSRLPLPHPTPPRFRCSSWAPSGRRSHSCSPAVRQQGQSGLARRSPRGHTHYGARPLARCYPPGLRGEPSPLGCRRWTVAALSCRPRVADFAALGRPGTDNAIKNHWNSKMRRIMRQQLKEQAAAATAATVEGDAR